MPYLVMIMKTKLTTNIGSIDVKGDGLIGFMPVVETLEEAIEWKGDSDAKIFEVKAFVGGE